jgi:hypothetical protein
LHDLSEGRRQGAPSGGASVANGGTARCRRGHDLGNLICFADNAVPPISSIYGPRNRKVRWSVGCNLGPGNLQAAPENWNLRAAGDALRNGACTLLLKGHMHSRHFFNYTERSLIIHGNTTLLLHGGGILSLYGGCPTRGKGGAVAAQPYAPRHERLLRRRR